MANWFDPKGFEKMMKDLEKLDAAMPQCKEKITKAMAAKLLSSVIKRTPVGVYGDTFDVVEGDEGKKELVPSSKLGGTLRRGWTVRGPFYSNGQYICEVFNPIEYAPYVEYGHRQTPGRYVAAINKRLKRGWVEGRFMLTKSLKDLDVAAPIIIKREVEKVIKEVYG